MADVTIKKKITIKRKGDIVDFTFTDKLKVKLFWDTATELDLCLFYKKKDGEVGGVFSNCFRNKKSDLGFADQFPFIEYQGDNAEPEPGAMQTEQINVYSLAEMEEAYICVLNYNAALNEEDVTFAQEGGRVELSTNAGDYLEVLADATEQGPVYCVCTIKNNNGTFGLKKCGDADHPEVMEVGTAFDKIPGFALICN